ncbi:MAG: carboxypeptidase-like regulatory domain-containing protein [Paludibacteraceae bacterium]|nr:carboxypeptidase-like regulatory domain-containing protein [Paludibacteraceae bacterium]
MKSEKTHSIWWRLILLSIFSFQFSFLPAVETIIVGEVVNDATGEPVPNVNIRFRGTKIGTTSDESGAYALRVDIQEKAVLVFSAVGYHSQRFEIEPGTMAGLEVTLHERTAALSELVVTPSENPALALLRRVREHRLENDRLLNPELITDVRREQTLYISQIQKRHLRRALWRSLQAGMMAQDDSTYILPLYRETQTFRLAGQEMIPANDQRSQAVVLTSTDYSSLLQLSGNLDFYQSNIALMGHSFLSPLAPSGNLYYRYYINEEEINSSNCVSITFRTRNPFYATFNGEMLIDTATFALRAVHAYVPPEVAVNYVNNIHISQTLAPDNSLADEHISVLLDFAVKTEQTATVFPTVLLTNHLHNPNISVSPCGEAAINNAESISNGEAYPRGEAADSLAFAALDSLPIVRTAKWFATIATTGYIPTGTPVDIGHIEEILQVNQPEGVHVGLPFRTNERFSRVVSLEAAVGYGFRDRSPKGLGRISVNLPTPRKNTLQLEYRDRYVWSEVDDFSRLLRENSIGYGNFDFTSYAFEALRRDTFCVSTMMRQRQGQIHWFADWSEGSAHSAALETHAYVRFGWQGGVAYQSLSAIARLSWGEHKYDGFFSRRYAYSSLYPVLYLGLETGHWTNTLNGEAYNAGTSNLYLHLRVMLTQHAQLGMSGSLSYALQAGAIFGSVPDFMLWQANANQGYAYDPYRFTLLHGGELTADKYIALHAEWNGQGILFNLIPGIRWLHLRELVEAKIVYGYLSHQLSARSDLYQQSPHSFYAEAGVGIGNILRVCDLYSVWSLVPTTSPLAAQQKGSAMWSMRFRIHLGL